MTCGIYCITNLVNGKQYVGQSVDIETRMNQHIHSDGDSKIHQAIMKYGVKNFRFEPLIRCSPEELDEQEVKFIRLLGTYENGYNQTRGGQHHVFNIEYNYETYSELKQKVSDKNKAINDLKQKNKKLYSRIAELTGEIQNLKMINSKIEQDPKNSAKLAKSTGLEMVKYKREIIELRHENKILSDEKQSLQHENEHLQMVIDSFKQQNLTEKIKSLSIEKNGLKEVIKEYKKEIRTLNKTIEEKDDIITQRDRQVRILHERLGWLPKTENIFTELFKKKKVRSGGK